MIDDSEVPVVGSVLERLADEVRVDHADDGESITLRMNPARLRTVSPSRSISAGSSTISSWRSAPVSSITRATRRPPRTTTSRAPRSRCVVSRDSTTRRPLESRKSTCAQVQHQHVGLVGEGGTDAFLDGLGGRQVHLAGKRGDGAQSTFRDVHVEQAHRGTAPIYHARR